MSGRRTTAPTRRGVLALVGTMALAGCGQLSGGRSGIDSVTLDGEALRALAEREAPVVPERVPVVIEREYLESNRERVHRLLDAVPTPLSAREVPNGAIREELASAHDRALKRLDAAESATTRYETMTALREAREEAGELNAAWRAIEDGLTREALLEDAAAVRRDVRAFDDRWRYVGEDPVRAVLIAARLEEGVRRGLGATSIDREELEAEQENPITVGELGGQVEGARAHLDDAGYIYDRHVASLGDAADLSERVRSASESALSAVDARRGVLPPFDPDDPSAAFDREAGDTPGALALQDLYRHVSNARAIEHARENGDPATVVLLAHETLARVEAFASLYGRIEGGERFAVEDASDVADHRSAAVRAVVAAESDASDPRLARRVVADLVRVIKYADREFADVRDEVDAEWISRDVARYVTVAATARGVPAATDRIASILEGE